MNLEQAPKPLVERLAELVAVLKPWRYSIADEAQLQRAIEARLITARIPHEREARLDANDRIDFLAGDIGIELKVDGSNADIVRQLHRYAQQPRIAALLLVTTRRRHVVPDALNGKEIVTLYVGNPFG